MQYEIIYSIYTKKGWRKKYSEIVDVPTKDDAYNFGKAKHPDFKVTVIKAI